MDVRRVVLLVGIALATRATAQPPAPLVPVAEKSTAARLQELEERNRRLEGLVEELRTRPTPALDVLTRPGEPPAPPTDGKPPVENKAGPTVDLTRGLRVTSADKRFQFELHNLSQFDGRFFNPTGDPLVNSFVIPRQRLYVSGLVDERFEFTSIINRGYGSLDILDAFTGYRFGKQAVLRVGRMKTPYTSEYYKTGESDLIAPERSVFVGNLAPNRQIGVMLAGELFAGTLEYAVGLFNGPQRSFQDSNNFKNPFVFLNSRPFRHGDAAWLKHLYFGGSFNYGFGDAPLEPTAFHTANDETTTPNVDAVSPGFLRFNPTARVAGEKALWAGEVNWFVRSLTAQAQYNGGFVSYAVNGRTIRVPYSGYSVAFTYFLTGEQPTTRKDITPLHDFELSDPLAHPGAVEAFARVGNLTAGSQIFTGGLADPTLWSRSALVTNLGVHWYPNEYIRVTFDYQRGEYGSPIQIAPGRTTDATNMFWVRTQLFY